MFGRSSNKPQALPEETVDARTVGAVSILPGVPLPRGLADAPQPEPELADVAPDEAATSFFGEAEQAAAQDETSGAEPSFVPEPAVGSAPVPPPYVPEPVAQEPVAPVAPVAPPPYVPEPVAQAPVAPVAPPPYVPEPVAQAPVAPVAPPAYAQPADASVQPTEFVVPDSLGDEDPFFTRIPAFSHVAAVPAPYLPNTAHADVAPMAPPPYVPEPVAQAPVAPMAPPPYVPEPVAQAPAAPMAPPPYVPAAPPAAPSFPGAVDAMASQVAAQVSASRNTAPAAGPSPEAGSGVGLVFADGSHAQLEGGPAGAALQQVANVLSGDQPRPEAAAPNE